jgi:hypothetical protein
VIVEPLAHRCRRDQQQGLGAGERVRQGSRVGEVGATHRHPVARESGEFIGIAAGGDDRVRWCAGSHQLFDDEAAELAGGSGDGYGRGCAFRWGSVVPN